MKARFYLPSILAALLLPACQSLPPSRIPEPGTFQRSGEIRLSVSTSKQRYDVGETLEFTVTPSEDAYLAAWVRGAGGKTRRIYPNDHDTGGVFRGGVTARFPGAGDFRFRVIPPAGRDTLIVIASKEPIGMSSSPSTGVWLKGISVEAPNQERRGEARVVYEVVR